MNVVITGCSQGIGYEIARIFIFSGDHRVVGISRTSEPLIELEKAGNKSIFKPIVYNLNDIKTSENTLLNKIRDHFDYVDILINNAGILINKPFISYTQEEILNIFNINLFAPAKLINTLIPFMGKKDKSHIVNIGSMGGFQGSSKYQGLSWYSSSKAALANLSESLSIELKDLNIAVNCLALGAVETPMLNKAFPGYTAPVKASEIAKFIVDFALTGHKYFNGKIIPVALSNP